jgi:cytochrome c oxidase cbb3-type subunit 2
MTGNERVVERGRRGRRNPLFWTGIAGVALLSWMMAACGDTQLEEAEVDTSRRPADFGYQTSVKTALLLEGRKAYEQYCIGCHGVAGDGAGVASRVMNPPPRSFATADFKFSSTRSGQLPTDEDLMRSITKGLRGTSMPSWAMLSERTRLALVAYIKTFSPRWEKEPPAPPIPMFDDPYRNQADRSAAIERGRKVYHGFFNCWTCHPSYASEDRMKQYTTELGGTPPAGFRPDLHLSPAKATSTGLPIYAPDFLRDYVRSGTDVADLYRSIAAGITGTAMPTWVDLFDNPLLDEQGRPIVVPSDLWAMAYFVQDLIRQRPLPLSRQLATMRPGRQVRFAEGGAVFTTEIPGQAPSGEDLGEWEEWGDGGDGGR